MMPKWGKSTDHGQNLISSEGCQDTSACQSSGHSSLLFSRKCPEVANLACFTKSKWCQNEENQQMMTKIYSVLSWSEYISMSNFRPFKLTAIKTQVCGSYHKHQVKSRMKKKMWKIEISNFGRTRNLCYVNYLEVSSWKIKSGCNKNPGQESTSTFILHGHKTKSKLQF